MRSAFLVFLSIILGASGCSFFSQKPKEVVTFRQPGQLFKVIDVTQLQSGGKLLISAFRAGSGVEASAELDKAAFMFIKGFADKLKENSSNFVVLGEDQASEADFVMEGHITRMNEPSRVKKWVALGDKKRQLSIDGKMINRSSGKEVLIFNDTLKAVHQKEDYKNLGETLGRQLAEKFLQSIQP